MNAPRLSRRALIAGAAGVGGAALVGCSMGKGSSSEASTQGTANGLVAATEPVYLPFYGPHQSGVTAVHQGSGLMAAFTVTAKDREELRQMLSTLTTESERIMTGRAYEERDPNLPPLYTGTVGNPPPPADLSITVSVGSSLFDERFGLADRIPADLEPMPFLANDRLDPARTHGDVLLSISSAHEDIDLFALRQIMRTTRGTLALHWMLDGYSRRVQAQPGEAGVRNLMGFVDGTSNLDPLDADQMDEFVWVDNDPGEPAWTTGGTYQVVRAIRMRVEFWDRARLTEQENLFGRKKASGAPLDGTVETDIPDYAADPDGKIIPLDAHIRLANPRTPETAKQMIFRKGINYSRGFDGAGQLDEGLAFVSYQRSIRNQFLPVQERLAGEPLEEYLVPEGGGYFYVLPGVESHDRYLGDTLLEG